MVRRVRKLSNIKRVRFPAYYDKSFIIFTIS